MERLERRTIGRVLFSSDAIVVVCDTEEVIPVRTRDIGPIGVGVVREPGTTSILGKDVILVSEPEIMYARAVREQELEDGSIVVGLAAQSLPRNVMQFIFQSIEKNVRSTSEADRTEGDSHIINSLGKGVAAYEGQTDVVAYESEDAPDDQFRQNAVMNIDDATRAVAEAQQAQEDAADAQEAYEQAALAVFEAEVALQAAQDSLAYLKDQADRANAACERAQETLGAEIEGD